MSDKIRIRNYGPLGIGTSELDGGSLTVPKFSFFIGDQRQEKVLLQSLFPLCLERKKQWYVRLSAQITFF